jgi:hypothetical protein
MRFPFVLSVILLSVALLSGCHQPDSDSRPLSLVTPPGYAKAQPIAPAASESWEKKALLAMVAPTIAENVEAADKARMQSPAAQPRHATASTAIPAPKTVAQAPEARHALPRHLAAAKHRRRHRSLAAHGRHHRDLLARR